MRVCACAHAGQTRDHLLVLLQPDPPSLSSPQDLKPGNLAVNEDCELKVKSHSRSPTDGEVVGILGEVGFVPRNPSPQPARFPVSLEP